MYFFFLVNFGYISLNNITMKPKPFKFLIEQKEKEINLQGLVNGGFRSGPIGNSGPIGIMGVDRTPEITNTHGIVGRFGYSYGDTGPIGVTGWSGFHGGDHNIQLALSGSNRSRDLNDQMLRTCIPLRSSDVYRQIDEAKDILPKGLRLLLEVGVNYSENEYYEPLNDTVVVDHLRTSILYLYMFGIGITYSMFMINKLLTGFVW